MKLVGIAKLLKLEEVSAKCAKGQIYFSNKRTNAQGEEEWETSFINARIVGQAKAKLDELANTMDCEKLAIEIKESSFKSVSYKDKNGNYKSYSEVVIFDFDIPDSKEQPKQTKKGYGKKN